MGGRGTLDGAAESTVPGSTARGSLPAWQSATVSSMSHSYLLVIGDAAPLAWVLTDRRMAFPALRKHQASALEVGDELLIYTTRGCFGNPGRDLGRVMALATVKTRVKDLGEPVVFSDRRYTSGCELDIKGLTPLRTGVELQPLVAQMHAFPDPKSWSVHLRRPLVPLDEHDATLLKERLAPLLEPPGRQLDAYQQVAAKRRVKAPAAP